MQLADDPCCRLFRQFSFIRRQELMFRKYVILNRNTPMIFRTCTAAGFFILSPAGRRRCRRGGGRRTGAGGRDRAGRGGRNGRRREQAHVRPAREAQARRGPREVGPLRGGEGDAAGLRDGGRGPKLKGSIGERPNHSNFSDQSSHSILSKFRNFGFPLEIQKFEFHEI